MMQPDAVLQPFSDVRPVRAGEFEPCECVGNSILLIPSADVDAGKILRALRCLQLREMDNIDRGLAFGREAFKRLGQRQLRPRMLQWHWAIGRRDGDGRTAGESREFLL